MWCTIVWCYSVNLKLPNPKRSTCNSSTVPAVVVVVHMEDVAGDVEVSFFCVFVYTSYIYIFVSQNN